MCFSKEASYVTGAVLIALGGYTILTNKQKKLLPAACIPLFFGLQQLAEGNIWSSFETGVPIPLASFEDLTDTKTLSTALYLMFAFFIWPIWIPLSALLPEKIAFRRTLLKTTLAIGIITTVISILTLKGNQITIKPYDHSIQYFLSKPFFLPLEPFLLFYGLAVIAPTFIASTRGFLIFGYTVIATVLISYYFYFNTFTSVWCFFSAWLSILIAMIIQAGNQEADEQKYAKESHIDKL